MRTAVDASKDQTYFLWGLTQEQLARTLFPLGEMTKAEVRALAVEFNLPVAKKHESYEICFVPNGDYAAFMDAYLRDKGIEPAGNRRRDRRMRKAAKLGRHAGAHHFTVGQRKGLGIAATEPLYVIATDAEIADRDGRDRMTICCAPTLIARDIRLGVVGGSGRAGARACAHPQSAHAGLGDALSAFRNPRRSAFR